MPTKEEKEQKQREAEIKSEKKVLNEDDSSFCGFSSFQIVDSDGLQKMNKGSTMSGVVHIEKSGGKVELVTSFPSDPLYYLELQRDAQLYLYGSMWYGEEKASKTNSIGRIIPKSTKALIDAMEKGGSNVAEISVMLPFLKNAASKDKLATMKISTIEEKFVTKVSEARLVLTEAAWLEWKTYRLNFWKLSKAWGSGWGDKKEEEDDKEGKDKDGDEKMKDK